MERQLDWFFGMWYLAHRLELAVKDALKGTRFHSIDEMLLRLYYLYEKSPQKCRELEEIILTSKSTCALTMLGSNQFVCVCLDGLLISLML